MTRRECLDKAAECVLQNRQDQYGDVENCFKKIARLWNAYLPSVVELEPYDVACMMALLKIARIQANPKHGDSWVDLAGYAACGADLAVPEPFRYDKPEAEGCEDLVQDSAVPEEYEGCMMMLEADAPQTREELLERIVDCNPATYGRARKPTGEELAEMAEEDAHV